MTVAEADRRPAGPTRDRRFVQRSDLRGLLYWVVGGVLLAVITSPQGRLGQPSYAVRQALKPAHLGKSLAVAIVAWFLVILWRWRRDDLREPMARGRQSVTAIWQNP